MRRIGYLLPTAAIGAALAMAVPGYAQDNQSEGPRVQGQEMPIPVSEVPSLALQAAERALQTTPRQADLFVGTTPEVYELTARNDSGELVKVAVVEDGTIISKTSGSNG
jgi:hypothetical protein